MRGFIIALLLSLPRASGQLSTDDAASGPPIDASPVGRQQMRELQRCADDFQKLDTSERDIMEAMAASDAGATYPEVEMQVLLTDSLSFSVDDASSKMDIGLQLEVSFVWRDDSLFRWDDVLVSNVGQLPRSFAGQLWRSRQFIRGCPGKKLLCLLSCSVRSAT